MSFLKLFSRDIEDEEIEEEDEEIQPIFQEMMRKKKNTMEDVLQTTVLETVLNDFHRLKIAQIHYEDDDMYIGLLLRAEDIGGLNKKSSKDRSTMIQQISGGDIKVYISDELLKREELLIVPDAETWENIGEYNFMREAQYSFQFIDEEGTIYDTKQKTTYKEIENAINSQKNLKNLIKQMPQSEENVAEQTDDEDTTVTENKAQIQENTQEQDLNNIPFDEDDAEVSEELDEEQPNYDTEIEDEDLYFDEEIQNEDVLSDTIELSDISEDMDTNTQAASVEDVMEQISDNDLDGFVLPEDFRDVPDPDIELEDEDDDINGDDTEIDVSEDEVESTIYRKFYSDELGLEISMTPFNSKFVNSADILPFKTDRDAGWMNEQLNEKSIQYNHEIKQFHQTNISRLRILYTKLMQEIVDKIRAEVDINVVGGNIGSNWFAEKYKELISKKENYDIPSEVEDYKRKITNKWEAKLQQIGEDAAKIAIQKYKEKYERQYEDELFNAEAYIKDKLENEYQDILRDLNIKRKITAQQRLEIYTDSVLKAVAEEYLSMQDQEVKRIHEIQQELDKFIDDHRKEDIAMAEVQQNEQKYKQKLEEQLMLHRAEIENYKKQLEEKERQYKIEMEKSSSNYQKIMNDKEMEFSAECSKLKNKNAELKEAYDELQEKFQKLEETKRAEYESKIEQIRTSNIALEEEVRVKDVENKRKFSGTIVIIVIAVIAALAIGFMIGTATMSPAKSSVNITTEKNI